MRVTTTNFILGLC